MDQQVQVTKTALIAWAHEDDTKRNEAVAQAVKATTAQFEVIVRGLIGYEPSVVFGLLSDTVASTKPVGEDGKPIKGGKADPVVSVRMSELRQVVGAVFGGWDVGPMLPRGREATVTEARAFLADNGLTAKGESVEAVARRSAARKLGRAARDLIEEVELSDEQVEKVEAGTPLALVLTEAQRTAIADKARSKVQQDAMAKRIETWQGRGDKFVDELMADGLGEDAILAMFERMKARALAVMKGEAAAM